MVEYLLNLKVSGEKEISNKISAIEDQIDDFTNVFYRIADDFRRTEKKKFDAEGAYDGAKKWKPLNKEYAKRKAMKKPKAKILEYSGALKQSLINKGDTNHILKVEPKELRMGTKKRVDGWGLARIHHFGTKRIPARPIIEITKQTAERWSDLLLRGIRQTLTMGAEKYKQYVPKGRRR